MVPCYTAADYIFRSRFTHYYLTFTSRAFGGVDICSIGEYDFQRKARPEDFRFFERLLALNPSSELPVVDPFLARYRKYHEEQSRIYHDRAPQLHLENMSYISLLLSPFLYSGAQQGDQGNTVRMVAFLTYIEEHLHLSVSVGEIAEHLDMTPNYLSDWLAENFRMRPVDYINRRRIEEAQHQLITTNKCIKEICADLGFASVSYFSRVFKARIGITASRYRSLYEVEIRR